MRRLLLLAPLALLVLAGSAPAATRTYSSHQLHAAVPDVGSLMRAIDVPDAGPVSFVAVGVRIADPRDSDLTLSLISPSGTSVLLTRRHAVGANFGSGPKGCSGALTWFQSTGLPDQISTGKPPFDDYYSPEQSFAALNGQEAKGRWQLRIDDRAAGATGTLLCWQLELSRKRRRARARFQGRRIGRPFVHRTALLQRQPRDHDPPSWRTDARGAYLALPMPRMPTSAVRHDRSPIRFMSSTSTVTVSRRC